MRLVQEKDKLSRRFLNIFLSWNYSEKETFLFIFFHKKWDTGKPVLMAEYDPSQAKKYQFPIER